jgi:REP element-mobilizing transposase RayT
MARLARAEVFAADEIAIVHVMNRVVRRCFLIRRDERTGRNYDHRKLWIEQLLEHFASCFGLDLLAFAILSNHFHLILRSRPDVVATWDDREVARRWLRLCPVRKQAGDWPKEPPEPELNALTSDAAKLAEIRSRLSDISWWMRLLCQRIAQRANAEEDQRQGKFWQNRYRAVRLLDEQAVLSCAAYVDLNPIRAALAETIEKSEHTSIQRRLQALDPSTASSHGKSSPTTSSTTSELDDSPTPDKVTCRTGANNSDRSPRGDGCLAPIRIDERRDVLGPQPSPSDLRCSDKGFLPMTTAAYAELLDWTARQIVPGKRGATPAILPAVFERLKIDQSTWLELVGNFGQLFSLVAGRPVCVEAHRSRLRGRRFHMRRASRERLSV